MATASLLNWIVQSKEKCAFLQSLCGVAFPLRCWEESPLGTLWELNVWDPWKGSPGFSALGDGSLGVKASSFSQAGWCCSRTDSSVLAQLQEQEAAACLNNYFLPPLWGVRNGKQMHSADCIWSWGHWSTSIYSFTFPTLNQVWSPRCPKLCRNYTVALAALLHWLVTLMIKKRNRTKHHPLFFFLYISWLCCAGWLAWWEAGMEKSLQHPAAHWRPEGTHRCCSWCMLVLCSVVAWQEPGKQGLSFKYSIR